MLCFALLFLFNWPIDLTALCFSINVYACLQYTGVGVPDNLQFELNIKFDSMKNDSGRMYYLHLPNSRENTRIIDAVKNKQECFTFFGYLVVSPEILQW